MVRGGCEAIRPLLSAALDDDLTRSEVDRLDRHLAACPACRARAAEYRSIRLLLRKLPPPPAPSPDLYRRVVEAIAISPTPWPPEGPAGSPPRHPPSRGRRPRRGRVRAASSPLRLLERLSGPLAPEDGRPVVLSPAPDRAPRPCPSRPRPPKIQVAPDAGEPRRAGPTWTWGNEMSQVFDDPEVLNLFLEETRERIEAIEPALVDLERAGSAAERERILHD
ncbi:MAG: zf-HC2 domain-containing protein, partial [Thermomicrobiaceae bacterium]|nr:zf-HC2 domain-containing protein [Thermomicrobiaceae bacterium]